MPRTVTIVPRLLPEILQARSETIEDSGLKQRYKIIWLLSIGIEAFQVANAVNCSAGYINKTVYTYNFLGLEIFDKWVGNIELESETLVVGNNAENFYFCPVDFDLIYFGLQEIDYTPLALKVGKMLHNPNFVP